MAKHWKNYVRNYSSRGGVKPRLVVLHTTESHNRPGISDLTSLISWFNNSSSQASSHFGVDAEGNTVRMVKDEHKSWTQRSYNPQALSIEQVGFAKTTRKDWMTDYHVQLRATARIIAHWCDKYKIPYQHSSRSGITRHVDISGPGGHWDPGPGYPFNYVINFARAWHYFYKAKKKSLLDINYVKYKLIERRLRKSAKKYGNKDPLYCK